MGEDPEAVVARQQTLQRALAPVSVNVEALRFMALDDEINNALFKRKVFLDDDQSTFVVETDPQYEVIDKINTLLNSPLPRTSFLTPKQAREEKIKLEILMLKLRITHRRKGKGFGPIIDALEMHYGSIIRDQLEGHRAKLWGERRVVAKVESRRKKKRRLGGLFG